MATALLALGTSDLASSAQVLAAGANAVLFMTAGATADLVPGGTGVQIQMQRADGTWTTVYALRAPDSLTAVVPGPCTFRVVRRAGSASVGVDMG